MCLWDLQDGRCVEHTKFPYTHTGVQVKTLLLSTKNTSRLSVHTGKLAIVAQAQSYQNTTPPFVMKYVQPRCGCAASVLVSCALCHSSFTLQERHSFAAKQNCSVVGVPVVTRTRRAAHLQRVLSRDPRDASTEPGGALLSAFSHSAGLDICAVHIEARQERRLVLRNTHTHTQTNNAHTHIHTHTFRSQWQFTTTQCEPNALSSQLP